MKENIFIMDHPLIQHKISMLRNETTGTNEFRQLVEEITVLMGYEALRDLPLEDVEIKTPIETCKSPMVSGKKLAIGSDSARRPRNGQRDDHPWSLRQKSATSECTEMKKPTSLTNISVNFRHRLSSGPLLLWTRCWPPAVPPYLLSISSRPTAVKILNSCALSQLRKVLNISANTIRTFRYTADTLTAA